METLRLDLHCHTRYSDGSDTVAQLVEKARAAGLGFVAPTDHDVVNDAAVAALRAAGIASCEAVEVSVRDAETGHSFHVLCYARKISDRIRALLAPVAEGRGSWEAKIAALAKRGLTGDYAGLLAWKKEHGCLGATGSRHVRAYLWQRPGNPERVRELVRLENERRVAAGQPPFAPEILAVRDSAAMHRLLWKEGGPLAAPDLFPKEPKVDLGELAAAARECGALLSVAHPNFSFMKKGGPQGWADRLDRYAQLGIEGVELNPFAGPEWVAEIRRQSEARGLVVTFGSDSHGPRDATHGALGEIHPEAARDEAWYAAHVRKFLDRAWAAERKGAA